MFAASTVRRFAASAPRLAARKLNGFAMFLKATKGQFPTGKGRAGFRARGRAVGAAWRKLSTQAKNKYAAAGAKVRVVKKKKAARKPNAYNKFVKKNFKTVRGTPAQRLKALAKKWQAARK